MVAKMLRLKRMVVWGMMALLTIGFGWQADSAHARVSLTQLQAEIDELQAENAAQQSAIDANTTGMNTNTGNINSNADNIDANTDVINTIVDQGCPAGSAVAGIDKDGHVICMRVERPSNRFVFVTSRAYNGNLGGVEGADAKCQQAANDAGLFGTYLAWISDGSQSPATRFDRSVVSYTRIDGQVIASNWNDLTDGNLISTFNRDEYGNTLQPYANVYVWTGTTASGNSANKADCGGWRSTSGSGHGGRTEYTDGNWTDRTFQPPCSAVFMHLYCFEQ